MRTVLAMLAVLALLMPCAARAQDGKAGIEAVGRALGEPGLKSIEYNAGGTIFQFGQSQAPGQPVLFEVFHDVLAQAVLNWRRRYVAKQEQEKIRQEEQARRAEEPGRESDHRSPQRPD